MTVVVVVVGSGCSGDIGFEGGSNSLLCCVNKGMGMFLIGGLGLRGHVPCRVPSQITPPAYFQKLTINTKGLVVDYLSDCPNLLVGSPN